MYENVRKSLEQCDVDADIELFVTTKSTGSERPGEYIPHVFSQTTFQILHTSTYHMYGLALSKTKSLEQGM